ncbi:MAG: glycosyltransferase family 4 protein [Candidatus Roizmanbacteria bacterium]|nr:glycosyltransferase family 4 protein [Candidatus Roizmanbacteria bacterium]
MKVRLGIDVRNLTQKRSGLVGYVTSLVSQLAADDHYDLVLFYNRTYRDYITSLLPPNVTLIPLYFDPHFLSVKNFLFERFQLKKIITDQKLSLFHNPFGYGVPPHMPIPTLLTVHDVIPLAGGYDDLSLFQRYIFRQSLATSVASASHIVAISAFTASELKRCIPLAASRPISIVHNGYDDLTNIHYSAEKLASVHDKTFILYLGSGVQRKNITNLVKAFIHFKKKTGSDSMLVVVSKFDRPETKKYKNAAQQLLRKEGLFDSVVFPGYLDQAQISYALRHCSAFIYPSFYEGFGLPILEAMAFDKPVICSNIPPFHEIAGENNLFFDPHNVNDIAHAIEQVLTNDAVRAQLIKNAQERKNMFSWEKMVKEYELIYQQMAVRSDQ